MIVLVYSSGYSAITLTQSHLLPQYFAVKIISTWQPKLLVLHNVVWQNEETGGGGLELDADVLSIHSSFIIANFEGLEAKDVDIGPWSRMLDTYHHFLNELLQTMCPADGETYNECWEDPDASYDSAYDSESGRLCGSHAEYIRRMFCDIRRHRRIRVLELDRELEPDHRIENIVLYAAQESKCPVPMISQGKGKAFIDHKFNVEGTPVVANAELTRIPSSFRNFYFTLYVRLGGGHHPLCQTVFAHYLLHLHDLDVGDKKKLEEVYSNITQIAIHNGMLQDSLEEINPNSDYIVEGAGPRVTPTVHEHHAFHQRRLVCRQRLLQETSYDAKTMSENYKVWLDNNLTVLDNISMSHDRTAVDDRLLKPLPVPQRRSLRL